MSWIRVEYVQSVDKTVASSCYLAEGWQHIPDPIRPILRVRTLGRAIACGFGWHFSVIRSGWYVSARDGYCIIGTYLSWSRMEILRLHGSSFCVTIPHL